MNRFSNAHTLAVATLCMALVGCSSVQPVAYSGLASSSELKTEPQNSSVRMPYRYATQVDWRRYKRIVIDPVAIYRGADDQFGDMGDQDKTTLANYAQSAFAKKLGKRFEVASDSGASTLRLKVTLTGAGTTTPVLGPFTHFDIGGNLYNGVQAIRGREAAFSGYVIYAVELRDASTNQLLQAYVTKQYPNAMNLAAAFGSLGAAKTGIDKGADELAEQFK
ncbi:DUF3313 domain-containing protein [Paraburkholderia rhynchosiae]|uniref:DUF3313 domain-containing protein n=1 Tax=Paraburkholderia rhynchosiae TaxID=487049 RepID=A0A2N7WBX6_9BURK|nr:DUF3313 domain-containing protein [Paraburkholderia rhynchosiae]PMS26908.1 DUF3313 domain-containing protein [Paraburkholderia rhynchosiae]CAB3726843.1 hypothetical protein LMG27174_05441 [Paraburkholderia rhynchosiae]